MKGLNKFKLKASVRKEEINLDPIEGGEDTQIWLEKEFLKTETKNSKRKTKRKEIKVMTNKEAKHSKSSITRNSNLKDEIRSNGTVHKQKTIDEEANSNTIGLILDDDTYKIIEDNNIKTGNAENDGNILKNSNALIEETENDGNGFENNNSNLSPKTEILEENLTGDSNLKKKKKRKKKSKKDKEDTGGNEGKKDKKKKKRKIKKEREEETLSSNLKQPLKESNFDSSASQINSINKDSIDFTTSQNTGNITELSHNLSIEKNQTETSKNSIKNKSGNSNMENNEISRSQDKYELVKENIEDVGLAHNSKEGENETWESRRSTKNNLVHPNIEDKKPTESTPDNDSFDETLSRSVMHSVQEESSITTKNSISNQSSQQFDSYSQQKKCRQLSNLTNNSKSKRIKSDNNVLDESFLQSLNGNNETSLHSVSSNISNSILNQSNQSDPSKLSTVLTITEKCMYILNKLLSNPLIFCILKNKNNGFGDIENKVRNQNYNNVQGLENDMKDLINITKQEVKENDNTDIYPLEHFHLLYEKLESYLKYFDTSSEVPDKFLITPPLDKSNSIKNIKYTPDKEICYIRIGDYETIKVKLHSSEHQLSDLHVPIFLLLEEFMMDEQYFINSDTVVKLFIIQNKHYYSTSNTNLIYLVDVIYRNKRYIFKVAPLLNPQLIDNGTNLNLDKPKSWVYLKVFNAIEVTSIFTSSSAIPFLRPRIYKNLEFKGGSCIKEVLRNLDT